MIEITTELKQKVVAELMRLRQNYNLNEAQFAKQWNISGTVWSQLKNGKYDKKLLANHWLTLARELKIGLNERIWNIAKTDVYNIIEEDIVFCQENSKGRIFVDDCGIGKTTTAKHLSRILKNCFYVDASQAKTKQLFIRLIAKTIGLESTGRFEDILENIKYYLKTIPKPIVIIDEAGDLVHDAFLELKGLCNATENNCGWYLMGADGLRAKVKKGINNQKVGYAEIFSRLSDRYSTIVPTDPQEKLQFYNKLIMDVLTVNCNDKKMIPMIAKKCLTTDETERIGGLRRAESLLILFQNQ